MPGCFTTLNEQKKTPSVSQESIENGDSDLYTGLVALDVCPVN